jgi:hypothetical protein
MNSGPSTVRWEWKVLLAPQAAERVALRAESLFAPDPFSDAAPHGAYAVSSVYLAAPGDADHTGTPRWRVRRYGSEDRIWLERKSNRAGRVEKVRHAADPAVFESPADPLPCSLEPRGGARAWLAEVEARGLVPAVTVAYERRAWSLPGTSARLTLDGNLRARPAARLTPEGEGGVAIEGRHVLELKFDDAPPAAFRTLLLEEGLLPRPWSKVRAAARALAGAETRRTPA